MSADTRPGDEPCTACGNPHPYDFDEDHGWSRRKRCASPPTPEWDATFEFRPDEPCAGCSDALGEFQVRVLTDGKRFAHNYFHAVLADQPRKEKP